MMMMTIFEHISDQSRTNFQVNLNNIHKGTDENRRMLKKQDKFITMVVYYFIDGTYLSVDLLMFYLFILFLIHFNPNSEVLDLTSGCFNLIKLKPSTN